MNARSVFATSLVLLAGCSAAPSQEPVGSSSAEVTDQQQALYIDGQHVGWVTHVDAQGLGTEIAITAMGTPMYTWIQASLDKDYHRKSGSIVTSDSGVMRKRDFVDARIVDITFPNAFNDSAGSSWKGATLVVRLDGALSPARPASDLPPPSEISGGIPRVSGVHCNCNAVSIQDVHIANGVVTALAGVEGDNPTLEFTTGEPKEMNVDLQFDDYEGRMHIVDVSVIDEIEGARRLPDGGIVRKVRIQGTLPTNPNAVP